MTQLKHYKIFINRDNLLTVSFAFFMGAFFFIDSSKAHRLVFFVFLVVPFFILHRNQLLAEQKSLLILLSTIFLSFLSLSILWSVNTEDSRLDKAL